MDWTQLETKDKKNSEHLACYLLKAWWEDMDLNMAFTETHDSLLGPTGAE